MAVLGWLLMTGGCSSKVTTKSGFTVFPTRNLCDPCKRYLQPSKYCMHLADNTQQEQENLA